MYRKNGYTIQIDNEAYAFVILNIVDFFLQWQWQQQRRAHWCCSCLCWDPLITKPLFWRKCWWGFSNGRVLVNIVGNHGQSAAGCVWWKRVENKITPSSSRMKTLFQDHLVRWKEFVLLHSITSLWGSCLTQYLACDIVKWHNDGLD